MIEIDDKIVSADLLRECFACDLGKCKGICCVEGDAGAPLDIEEVDLLEEEYENYAPYMTAEGREAIERAYREGKCQFLKPISCHLYPIRVKQFRNGTYGLNYHRWAVCRDAVECGKKLGVPVYKALKEPIIRRFGEEFYKALECAEQLLSQDQE